MTNRQNVVMGVLVVASALAATLWADQAGKSTMHSTVFDWNALKVEEKPHGARREVFDAPTATLDRLECHVTTLKPGAVPHAAHKHAEEELIIVKVGTLEVVQNGMTNQAATGSVIFEGSNEVHGLRNTGSTTATYYVFKWYPHGTAKDKKP